MLDLPGDSLKAGPEVEACVGHIRSISPSARSGQVAMAVQGRAGLGSHLMESGPESTRPVAVTPGECSLSCRKASPGARITGAKSLGIIHNLKDTSSGI